jgi:CRISPR-associated protein Csd1
VTVLQALNSYYDRMAARGEVDLPGFSREKIGFAIQLAADGTPIDAIDLRRTDGKRISPVLLSVPAAVKRTVAVMPNLFWDKSAYVLGRTAGIDKRTAEEHAAFKAANLALLAGTNDPGLIALRQFLETWTPKRFDASPFSAEMLDTNIVFRFGDERGYIHEREAARQLLASRASGAAEGFCLVTGRLAPIQRLHPAIKNIDGAQSSGASLVSFNLDAFTSYGQEQGDNAPTSEQAAFQYGTALNRLLDRNTSRNRLKGRIGDATVVFWADSSGVGDEAAEAAERFFEAATGENDDQDAGEAAKIRDALDLVRKGRPIASLGLGLKEGTKFYVLGLSPNAARLSVRYWLADDFSAFARNLAEHDGDLRLEPPPFRWGNTPPSVQRLLVRTTALQEKFDNIPELLAGETMRAVLTGERYPRTLLTTAINRLRVGDDPGSGWHAAVIKAVLARDLRKTKSKEEIPVALDEDSDNQAYQLGRLFALLEAAQYAALGRVNAPIGARYYGSASANPALVFGRLLRGSKTHLADARKRGKGGWIEPRMIEVIRTMPDKLPTSLSLEDQGRFAIGYYHERATRRVAEVVSENEHEGGDE